MPEYDNPEMAYGDERDQYSFFYFWFTKFIIRVNYTQGLDYFRIYVMKENDEMFFNLKIELGGMYKFPVLVSPNGKCLGYL